MYQEEFAGARIKTSTMYSMAFGEEADISISRPLPKSKEANKRRNRAEKKAEVVSDFSYEYNFERDPKTKKKSGKHGSKSFKIEGISADDLLDTLTVDMLEAVLARHDDSASAMAKFQTLIGNMESHFLSSRAEKYTSSPEKWQSFLLPYARTSDEVVDFLTNWFTTNLTEDEQRTATEFIVRNLLENARSKTPTSGYGLRLAAQILLRESPWNFISLFSLLKTYMSPVGGIYSIPDNFLYLFQYLGAQQFASSDEDAPFAAFLFSIEILSYNAFHGKDSLCLEYLSSAYAGYRRVYGSKVNAGHLRMPTLVAERALQDLARINPKNQNFAPILPILTPLRELILELAVLSMNSSHISKFWFVTIEHSQEAWKKFLPTLNPKMLKEYDDECKEAVNQLVITIGSHMSDIAPKGVSPVPEDLHKVAQAFLSRFNYKAPPKKEEPHEVQPSKKSKHRSAKQGKPERGVGFCGLLFYALFFLVLCALGARIWTHHVPAATKNEVHLLTERALNLSKPYCENAVSFAKPHYERAVGVAKPHLDNVCAAIKPHIDSAYAASKPLLDDVCKVVEPHFNTARALVHQYCELATPHVATAWESTKPYLLAAEKKTAELVVLAWHKTIEGVALAAPVVGRLVLQAVVQLRVFLSLAYDFLAKQLSLLVEQFNVHLAPSVMPHVNTVVAAVSPILQPVATFLRPPLQVFVDSLKDLLNFVDELLTLQ